jgi:hypothetical protein
VARAFRAPSLRGPEAAQCQGDGTRPAEPSPRGAVLRCLCVDEAEAAPLSPAVELPRHGAARARARGLVWPSDTGYTWRTTLLPAARRRPLPIHVGCGPWQQGRGCGAISRAQTAAEAECGRKLRVLRTDNGGEFTTAEFASYYADEGVQRHYSAPYRPQQNGVVKRRNQMIVGMARALLKQRGMSTVFWGEAVMTAVYILNRSPTKDLNGRTPYEAWHGRKPAVSHLRVFGCLTFGKELGHIGKLDDRSTPGVFIGYAEGSKAYRILDPGTQCVRTMRDVVFDEGRGWIWDKAVDDVSTPTSDNFSVEYVHFKGVGGVDSSLSPSMSTPVPESPPTSALRCPATTSAAMMSSPPPPQPVPLCTPAATATPQGMSNPAPAHVEPSPVEFATPLSHDEERIDACYDARAVMVPYDGGPSQRPTSARTSAPRPGGAVAPCVRRRQASVFHRGRERRGMTCRDEEGDGCG